MIITEKTRQATEQYLATRTDPSPALFIGFQLANRRLRSLAGSETIPAIAVLLDTLRSGG